jgi:hypothetical protein
VDSTQYTGRNGNASRVERKCEKKKQKDDGYGDIPVVTKWLEFKVWT